MECAHSMGDDNRARSLSPDRSRPGLDALHDGGANGPGRSAFYRHFGFRSHGRPPRWTGSAPPRFERSPFGSCRDWNSPGPAERAPDSLARGLPKRGRFHEVSLTEAQGLLREREEDFARFRVGMALRMS